jgi:hypothetical protein
MTLLKIIFFLVVIAPGKPPVPHTEEMATLTDCQMAAQQAWEDAYAAMQEGKAGAVQAGCVLVNQDKPT